MTDNTADLPPVLRRISSVQTEWRTARPSLRVLIVIHSLTAATRLVDILPIFNDRRVQLFCTQTSDAMFSSGVRAFMEAQGFLCLTWEQAISLESDIVVTASLGDNLHELKSAILRLPHGNGYNKWWIREPGVFGLSAETLMHKGSLVPAAIGLSHSEQFDRLSEGCPEALPCAFVAGDPCYDRLLASVPRRLHYRHAFRLRPGQRLLTVSSTWQEGSLFGLDPLLVSRLLADLPYDEFRVALVLHPNIWACHSRLQIESWLFDALRAGLILIPPQEGWRAAVVASDWVLSDHGSVSIYAAAVGRPVLLEKNGRSTIDPRSGLGRLIDAAPALDPLAPIRPQLARAERLREHTHAVAAAWVSSAPKRSLHLIREQVYRMIGVLPPETEPALLAVESPGIDDTPPSSLWMYVEPADDVAPGALRVARIPAAVGGRTPPPGFSHAGVLIVSDDELDHRLSALADVIGVSAAALPSDEEAWSAAVFEYRAGVQLTVVHDARSARVRTRTGDSALIRLASLDHPEDAELMLAVLAERIVTTADGLDAIARLSPLVLSVSPGRTVTADFRVCAA